MTTQNIHASNKELHMQMDCSLIEQWKCNNCSDNFKSIRVPLHAIETEEFAIWYSILGIW